MAKRRKADNIMAKRRKADNIMAKRRKAVLSSYILEILNKKSKE
jgi:hypothetical protein